MHCINPEFFFVFQGASKSVEQRLNTVSRQLCKVMNKAYCMSFTKCIKHSYAKCIKYSIWIMHRNCPLRVKVCEKIFLVQVSRRERHENVR